MGPTAIFVGRSTLDIVYACSRFPGPDDKIDAARNYVSGGGPALNAAVAFAGLGGRARLCSPIGEGPLADGAREDVQGFGVEIFDAAAGERDVLPVSSIILTGSSRAVVTQILSDRPALLADETLERLFAGRPDIVLSDGHVPELALPILRRAHEAGVHTVLDGGSWKPWTADLLPWIDTALLSCRFQPPGAGDPLADICAVAVTNGPGPVRWRAGAASGEITPLQVEAVDTLGAGDIFHGAFCHAFAVSRDLPASLARAADVASRSCTSWGPRRWIGADLDFPPPSRGEGSRPLRRR